MTDEENQTIEVGAAWLAKLAYPEDGKNREKLNQALIYNILRKRLRQGERISREQGESFSALDKTRRSREAQFNILEKGSRIAERRSEAATLAWPKFKDHFIKTYGAFVDKDVKELQRLLFQPYERPRGVSGHMSRDALIGAAHAIMRKKSDDDDVNLANVKTRLWRESKPVLHMGIALNSLYAEGLFRDRCTFEALLEDRNLLREAIERANYCRLYVARVFKIPFDDLIKFPPLN